MKVQSSGVRVHVPDPQSKMSFRMRGNDAESANQKPDFAPEFLLCFAFPSRLTKGSRMCRRRFIIRSLSDLCSIQHVDWKSAMKSGRNEAPAPFALRFRG